MELLGAVDRLVATKLILQAAASVCRLVAALHRAAEISLSNVRPGHQW
jgi:hypothetical protein